MTYDRVINYTLNKQVKKELDESVADKQAGTLTDEDRKCIVIQGENKTRTLNICFTACEYKHIVSEREQSVYKKKYDFVHDCIRARVLTTTLKIDLSEMNQDNCIFFEKVSGANTDRVQLKAMIGYVCEVDTSASRALVV